MKPQRLDVNSVAADELDAAIAWYASRSRQAAVGFMEAVDRALLEIAEGPERWPLGFRGTRRFALHRYPYVIIFRVGRDATEAIAVMHGRRKPGYWRDRL